MTKNAKIAHNGKEKEEKSKVIRYIEKGKQEKTPMKKSRYFSKEKGNHTSQNVEYT